MRQVLGAVRAARAHVDGEEAIVTWAKLDDRLHADPRLPLAGLEAFGLHCAALTWMGAFLTDGEITAAQVKRLAGRRGLTLAAKLVSSGFWIEISPEKWVVFEWETLNPRPMVTARHPLRNPRSTSLVRSAPSFSPAFPLAKRS